MKIGIFADVHGNIYAFEKMLKSLKKESVELYVFCGDICGYYYYQNEIIDILRGMNNLICVAGNHDRMFLRILHDKAFSEEYRTLYGKSSCLLKENIKKENLEFLENMPDRYVLDDHGIAIFHGSPWDNLNGYVYPTDSLKRFEELPYKYILLGHTHYPMSRSLKSVNIINPGSCGQSRDYRDLSYAILDLQQEGVEFKRTQYDVDSMIKDVRKHNEENSYLVTVLQRRRIDRE